MNDHELLRSIAVKDPQAFRYIYSMYFGMVSCFVQKNKGNEEDAKDVFQDALVVVYEKTLRSDFSLQCSLKTFLYSVCRNIWLKKLSRSTSTAHLTDVEEYVSIEEESSENTEEQEEKVHAALQQLGDKCRQILTLFFYYKKRMEEIATELSYANADTVKNQKYKCMQQLKRIMTNG
jgi:RNA polymerase sigma factor (sigma-70 family)